MAISILCFALAFLILAAGLILICRNALRDKKISGSCRRLRDSGKNRVRVGTFWMTQDDDTTDGSVQVQVAVTGMSREAKKALYKDLFNLLGGKDDSGKRTDQKI